MLSGDFTIIRKWWFNTYFHGNQRYRTVVVRLPNLHLCEPNNRSGSEVPHFNVQPNTRKWHFHHELGFLQKWSFWTCPLSSHLWEPTTRWKGRKFKSCEPSLYTLTIGNITASCRQSLWWWFMAIYYGGNVVEDRAIMSELEQ